MNFVVWLVLLSLLAWILCIITICFAILFIVFILCRMVYDEYKENRSIAND